MFVGGRHFLYVECAVTTGDGPTLVEVIQEVYIKGAPA